MANWVKVTDPSGGPVLLNLDHVVTMIRNPSGFTDVRLVSPTRQDGSYHISIREHPDALAPSAR